MTSECKDDQIRFMFTPKVLYQSNEANMRPIIVDIDASVEPQQNVTKNKHDNSSDTQAQSWYSTIFTK